MEVVFTNIVFVAIPFFFAFMIVEFIYSRWKGHSNKYSLNDFLVNVFMTLGVLVMELTLKFAAAGTFFYLSYNFFNPEIDGVRTNILGYQSFGWEWYLWILCLLADDLSHYWVHRLNHTVRFMWASHVVHHSSEHFNLGTSLRLDWVSKLYKPLFYLWIPALGIHPEMLLLCYGIETIYQFFLHTSYCPRFIWLEKILITPKQHEMHHSRNVEYLDKNHGAIFSLFDKIFGSWKDYDDSIQIKYGVTKPPNLNNPIDILTHEYRAIWKDLKTSKNIIEAFMYVFGPPGWSPDGSTLTVKQIQRELKLKAG